MNKQASLIIATSIYPGNFEGQQSAVASWKRLGCSIISVNVKAEIDQLSDVFPDIDFMEVARSAAPLTGKNHVYLDDVLVVLKNSGAPICGIVNSDVILTDDPAFFQLLESEAPNSLVFGQRLDVNSPTSREGDVYTWGFDYFFFDRRFAGIYPNSDLCLGAPWWDYWVPLVPLLLNKSVKLLISPVAYHPKHDIKWSKDLWFSFGHKFSDQIFGNVFSFVPGLEGLENDPVIPNGYLAIFSSYILNATKDNPIIITCNPSDCSGDDNRFAPKPLHRPGFNKARLMNDVLLDPNVAATRAETLTKRGDDTQALKILSDSCNRYPDSVGARLSLGMFHYKSGDNLSALHNFERAYGMDGNDRDITFAYVDLLMLAGNIQKAIDVGNNYLGLHPNDKEAKDFLKNIVSKSFEI